MPAFFNGGKMTILEMWKQMTGGELAGWVLTILILFLSLIQISPLKLNPWDSIFCWFGQKLTGSIRNELGDLRKQITELWINTHRQTILTFARECRNDTDHSGEEWNYILTICGEYEDYCIKHQVTNGVVRENTRYIRELFHELSKQHKI